MRKASSFVCTAALIVFQSAAPPVPEELQAAYVEQPQFVEQQLPFLPESGANEAGEEATEC